MDPLDETKRKDVKRVLHDQFCDLEIEGQGNTCSIQNLKYRVMGISCEVFQITQKLNKLCSKAFMSYAFINKKGKKSFL